jgi:hypothetical protein
LQQVYKIKVDKNGFSILPEKRIKNWFKTGEINTPQPDINLKVAKIENLTLKNNERKFDLNNVRLNEIVEIGGIRLLEEGGEMSFGVDNDLRLHITQDPKDLSSISFALKSSSESQKY